MLGKLIIFRCFLWIVSPSWIMHKRIIGFELFENPHTGRAIYTTIMKTICDFKHKDKIMSISLIMQKIIPR